MVTFSCDTSPLDDLQLIYHHRFGKRELQSTVHNCRLPVSIEVIHAVYPLANSSYDSVEASALLFGDGAAVAKGATAMPKLPTKVGEHPGGAGSEGVIFCVTACGMATGFAVAIAAKARRAYEYRIFSCY